MQKLYHDQDGIEENFNSKSADLNQQYKEKEFPDCFLKDNKH